MSGFVNFNGLLLEQGTAIFTADSRAFRYGDGLFETMRTTVGDIRLKELHFERLFNGIETLQIKLPAGINAAVLEQEVFRTISRNNITGEARVRLSVFRGEGGLYQPEGPGSGYVIQVWPLPSLATINENGLVLGVYKDAKKSCDKLANLKSNNYLIYLMAALHCKNKRWNDCLVLNHHDRVCDGSIANVFWVKEGKIFTPPLSEGGVAGVMRKHLLEILPAKGFIVEQRQSAVVDIETADEVFLTNAVTGIRWAKELNGRVFGNKIIMKLWKATF